MSLMETGHAKKKKQQKKNKYHQMLYELVRLRREDSQRVAQEEVLLRKPSVREGKSDEEMIWSEKVNTVRNRLTDKKRASKERWNRFSGTGDEGGRGL